ncbi:MAG: DUF2029 domain-containing protein [Lachnospiraceae bacterium]|nr:DUF2029 domain-containing protein [Lachnospiraceae bacterium]
MSFKGSMEPLMLIYRRIRGDRRCQRVILIITGILAAVSLVQGCKNAILFSQDFQWDAAKTLVLRINPYDVSLAPEGIPDFCDFSQYYLQMEANQFPSLLFLLFPYTFLPALAARYAWLISNLVFTAGIIVLLRKTFLQTADAFTFRFFMLLMIAGTPYRNQLGVGQHTLFAVCFFLLAVYLTDRQERDPAGAEGKLNIGASLALCVSYFKYTLTVPLALYFIYRKKYRELILSVLPHIILTFFAAWWLNDSFIHMITKPLLVSSRLMGEGGLDFGVFLRLTQLRGEYVLLGIVLIYLFVLSLRFGRGKERETAEKSLCFSGNSGTVPDGILISVLTLWSLIITYHRTYDFFVLVIVLSMMLWPACPGHIKIWYGVVLLGVFFVLRLFSESMPSKIAVGIIYYSFVLAVSWQAERFLKGSDGIDKRGV